MFQQRGNVGNPSGPVTIGFVALDARGMKLHRAPIVLQLAALLLMASPVSAKPVYQGFSHGTYYDIHIDSMQSLGNDRWRFRTRAEYSGGQPDFVSEWREADCSLGTVDGEVVPEVAEYGYQRGAPEVFRAICGEH